MYPQGDDCFKGPVLLECQKLISSKTRFQSYPHEGRLRLALVGEVSWPSPASPLRLTLLHGECAGVSCEGGIPSRCRNYKRDLPWRDVGRPYDFHNCTANHYYCVSASIGDCCSICTETIFLPDLPSGLHATQDSQPLLSQSLSALAGLLTVVIALAAIFVKLISVYTTGTLRSYKEVHTPKSQDIAFPPLKSLNETATKTKAIIVYIKEDCVSFNNDINSLQSFLWKMRIHVKDVYSEEEYIDESIKVWVRKIMQDKDAKIVLVETERLRLFLNHGRAQLERARSVEKAVVYLLSCIPMLDQYNKVFVVRLQKTEEIMKVERCGSNDILHPGNGRIYSYPTNRERLAQDLLVPGKHKYAHMFFTNHQYLKYFVKTKNIEKMLRV